VLAERLGFDECWFAEHHFTDYSLLPSPNLMIAAAAQRTRRLRFGNYVNALSFHHPLRLAAEAAMLDNLARHRPVPAAAAAVPRDLRGRARRGRAGGGRAGVAGVLASVVAGATAATG